MTFLGTMDQMKMCNGKTMGNPSFLASFISLFSFQAYKHHSSTLHSHQLGFQQQTVIAVKNSIDKPTVNNQTGLPLSSDFLYSVRHTWYY